MTGSLYTGYTVLVGDDDTLKTWFKYITHTNTLNTLLHMTL